MIKFFRHFRLRLLTQESDVVNTKEEASSDKVRQTMIKAPSESTHPPEAEAGNPTSAEPFDEVNTKEKASVDNRVSKYLLYAIGEIVLVVIGILIALSINNWNQERINRAQNDELLKGIVKDLNQDISSLNQSIDFTESRLAFLERHMSKSDFSNTATDTLFAIFDGTARPFGMTHLSYEKAKNLGVSELTSNDSLDLRINKYYTHTLDWSKLMRQVQYDEMTKLNDFWIKDQKGLEFEFNVSFQIPYMQDPVERRNNAIAGIMSPRGRNHIRLECYGQENVLKIHMRNRETAKGLKRDIEAYLLQ